MPFPPSSCRSHSLAAICRLGAWVGVICIVGASGAQSGFELERMRLVAQQRFGAAGGDRGAGRRAAGRLRRGAGRLTLSATGDLVEAAAALFDTLREADRLAGPGGRIAFAPVPQAGLGRAINDRLRRAAAPRD